MFNKPSRTEPSETPQEPAASTQTMVEDREEVKPDVSEAGAPEFSGTDTRSEPSDEWQGKYQLLQDQFTRLAADFDNYRKRMREEQEQLARYGAQKTVTELLSVLDNLDRAAGSLNETSDPKVLYKSFSLMQKQLLDAFEGLGVKKMQVIGQPFDPQYHEAVSQMESKEFPENSVAYEAQSGYLLHDRVLRPAQVVVSTGSSTDAETSEQPAQTPEEKPNPFRQA